MSKESVGKLEIRVDSVYLNAAQHIAEGIRLAALTNTSLLGQKVFDIIAEVKKGVTLLQDEIGLIIKIGVALCTASDTKGIMTSDCFQILNEVIERFILIYE